MKNLEKIKKLQHWNGARANSAGMCGMLAMACALSASMALGQDHVAAVRHAATSNPQLASPAIEKRVNALLKQMTLEEKLGQLVQYSDSGYDGEAETAAEAAAAPGKNPAAHDKVDAMELVSTGRLGSMLNTVGQARTNALQHAAVEKSRLHIPLMFGADIIHGYNLARPSFMGTRRSIRFRLVLRRPSIRTW